MNKLRGPTRSGKWSGGLQGFCLYGLVLLLGLLWGCGREDQPRSVRLPSQKPVAESSEVGVGDLYAVVVGVSNYANSRIPSLKFADKDARDFADFLKTQKELFRNVYLTMLLNEQATQKEVKRQLFYELRRAGKNDSVILFLAGHGADDPKMPGEFFFLTHDADPEILEGSAVNMGRSWFMQRLDSKRVLVIADTCHAGGFSTDGARGNESALRKLMSQFQESEGRVFLTSSRPDEISREEASLGNGVFTHYLLEGLRGKASRSSDGVVTLQDAYEYVYEKTNKATKGMQHPQMEGRVVGKFPMSLVRLEPSSVPVPQPSSQPATVQLPPSQMDRLRTQAEAGDAKAQFELGVKYEFGFGVTKDPAEALKWYCRASEKGISDAKAAIARLTPRRVAPSAPPPASVKHDPSIDSALIEAAKTGDLDLMKRLLLEEAQVDSADKRNQTGQGFSYNPLRIEAEINSTDERNQTALFWAATFGSTALVQWLLDRGAEVNAADAWKQTALHAAARHGHTATVQLLLDRGADVKACLVDSARTALHEAAANGNTDTVRLLLDRGADVNAESSFGTPLRVAASLGHLGVVKLLVDRGADVRARSEDGKTALDIATAKGYWEVAQVLRNYLGGQTSPSDGKRGW